LGEGGWRRVSCSCGEGNKDHIVMLRNIPLSTQFILEYHKATLWTVLSSGESMVVGSLAIVGRVFLLQYFHASFLPEMQRGTRYCAEYFHRAEYIRTNSRAADRATGACLPACRRARARACGCEWVHARCMLKQVLRKDIPYPS
jgi:hypothetical protein